MFIISFFYFNFYLINLFVFESTWNRIELFFLKKYIIHIYIIDSYTISSFSVIIFFIIAFIIFLIVYMEKNKKIDEERKPDTKGAKW